ncbi:MAG TPA: DMT family transporter [Pseudolabrys sp.]
MENIVFAAVLVGALAHASWNALIKGVALDPLSTTTLICIGSAIVSLALLPFVGNPAWASWPWLLASLAIHLVYFAALAEAYRAGDLGQVYPIARGSAPLMTAAATTLLIGEKLPLLGWIGIVVLVSGVFLLSLKGGRDIAKIDRRAVGYALLTAASICAYTVVDGIGARVSGNSLGYVLWLFITTPLVVVTYALYRDGACIMPAMAGYWRRGLFGGAFQIVSYGIVLWAMTLVPIAVVATLRETSVLFGAAIAVVVLKEPLRPVRIVAAVLIVCGLVAIRLQ